MRRPAARRLLLVALLALFGARLVHTASVKTLTADEPHYVGTALYLWETGDYDFARSLRFHPPLAFHLAGLPLLGLDLTAHEKSAKLGGELIRGEDPQPQRIRVLSRVPFVALAVWGALLVSLWALEAAGWRAGLLAAFLTTFSPMLLAHGSLAHSDITVTVLYVQTLYLCWRWWRHPTPVRYGLCGLSLGLALSAKLSALLLLPALGLLLLGTAFRLGPLAGEADDWTTRPGIALRLCRVAVMYSGWLALGTFVIWLSYGGSFEVGDSGPGLADGLRLPAYLNSLLFDVTANAKGRSVFFFGHFSDDGYWYFLPVAFLVKTPIGMLMLLVLALFTPATRARPVGPFLGIAALVYWLAACFVLQVPLGLRYVLPMFPLAHVFAATRLGPSLPDDLRGIARSWRGVAVTGACGWIALSSAWIHPHYLAYFNESIGPANAYRHLVESNLDWGQDLGELARWAEANGDPEVHLAFFGVERPETYGLHATPLRSCEPVSGVVAISATLVQGLYGPANPFKRAPEGCFSWLLEREPIAQPGYSILVYDVP